MSESDSEHLDLRTATTCQITQAMRRGLEEALRLHREAGQPVVVWDREQDEIMSLPAEEIGISEDLAEPSFEPNERPWGNYLPRPRSDEPT